jgi:rhodanese-related sulfurtransferase
MYRMASKKSHKKASSQQKIVLFAGLAILAIAVFAFLAPNLFAQRNPTVQLLTAQAYNADFLDKNENHFLLDVRRPDEFASGHIAGATNINVDYLADQLSRVPKDVPVVIYCRSGNRSAVAANILAEAGYTEIYDMGGIIDWQRASYPIEY